MHVGGGGGGGVSAGQKLCTKARRALKNKWAGRAEPDLSRD